jgi:hypothetical protein
MRTKPMIVRTNLLVVGTKTYGCGNKSMIVGTKHMVVGTKLYGCYNTHLGMWEQKT